MSFGGVGLITECVYGTQSIFASHYLRPGDNFDRAHFPSSTMHPILEPDPQRHWSPLISKF